MPDRPRIILHTDAPEPLRDRLLDVMPRAKVALCDDYDGLRDLVPAFRPDIVYSVCFAGSAGFPAAVLAGAHGPRWIAVGGSGCDHLGAWDAARVTVTNAPGLAAGMMAEYALGCLLHFTLDIDGLAADKAARVWRARRVRPLAGRTLLIVGLGHTGQALAARAKALGMSVIGTRARPRPVPHVDEIHPADAVATLWGRADAIVISVPLLAATRGLVDRAAFAAMKPGVLLVDVSRGGVVVEAALIAALKSGQVAGAALDVFGTEPLPPDSPLWGVERVIISPHCSAASAEWDGAVFGVFLDNLRNWLAGRPLFNVVNPGRGY